jgi:hypothetical protein
MPSKIYKYPLHYFRDDESIYMPAGAQILSVGVQNDLPMIWALVDPQQPPELRKILTFETGQEIFEEPGVFIGTYILHGGALVYHVFEARNNAQDVEPKT